MKCPECNNDVSTLAKSCPKCGAPITAISKNFNQSEEITTVQLTSKKLKKQGCIYPIVLIIIALIIGQAGHFGARTGVFLVLAAVIIYIITNIRIWWHHK